MTDQKKPRWRLYLTIATFIALAVLIYSLRQQIGGVVDNLGKVNTLALLLIIPCEFLNYDAYARLYRSLFATLGKYVRYWPMFKVTLELNFVNHVLPSGGLSGISYFNVPTRPEGINAPTSPLAQVPKFFLLYATFHPL